MLEVKGFRAFRFSPEKVGTLDNVITPPYDVISPDERRAFTQRSPQSMAHLLLPEAAEGVDRYERAGRLLDSWIADGFVRQDPEESIYLHEQQFTGLDGAQYVRRGFMAVTRLPEADEKLVLGHERTFSKPIEDRLFLTEATRANLGVIFVLYADPDNSLAAHVAPHYEAAPESEAAVPDGTTVRLWRAPCDAFMKDFFQDKKLYIADGHHRFETAITYRDRMRARMGADGKGLYDYTLMGFVSFSDPGLKIYPPHRLLDPPPGFDAGEFLSALEKWFDVMPAGDDLEEGVRTAANCVLGLALNGTGRYLLKLKSVDRAAFLGDDKAPAWRDLDVAVLHRGIIERILGLPEDTQLTYERSASVALEKVRSGEKGLAFLLKAVRPEQVQACAQAKEPMPQKSTYFFPKIPSGAVIYRMA